LEFCDYVDNDCDNIYWDNGYKNDWPTNIDEGFNLTDDPFNCGGCGNICYYQHAYSSCVNGNCRFDGCYENYYDLDGDPGCEYYCVYTGKEVCGNKIDDDCDSYVDEGCRSVSKRRIHMN
jgi:hypothetical protein